MDIKRKQDYKYISNIIPITLILFITLILSYLINQIYPSYLYTSVFPAILLLIQLITVIDLIFRIATVIEVDETGIKKYYFNKLVIDLNWSDIKDTKHFQLHLFNHLIYEFILLKGEGKSLRLSSELVETYKKTVLPRFSKDLTFVQPDGIALLDKLKIKLGIFTTYTHKMTRHFIEVIVLIFIIIIFAVNFVFIDYSELGQLAFMAKDYPKSIGYLNKAINKNPNDPELYYYLGNSYLNSNMTNEALENFRKASYLDTNNSQYIFMIGITAVKIKQDLMALNAFNNAIKMNPTLVRGYAEIGAAYLRLNKPDLAIKNLTKAMDLGDRSAFVFRNLASSYMLKKNYSEALNFINKAVEMSPYEYENHWIMGKLYLEMHKYNDAVKALGKAEVLNPRNSSILSDSGICYLYLNKPKLAVEKLGKALIIEPDNYQYNFNLAYIYFKNKNPGKALNLLSYKGADKIVPDIYPAIANTERVIAIKEIEVFLSSLLKLNPDNPNVLYLLAKTNLSLNENDKALKNYLQLKKIEPDLASRLALEVNYE